MEVDLAEAKSRLSELVAAAQSGERVVITEHGEPAAELVRSRRSDGIDFDKLASTCERIGVGKDEAGWPVGLDDQALSRRVLGVD